MNGKEIWSKYKKWWIVLLIVVLVSGAGICVYARPEIRLLMCAKNVQKELETLEKPALFELSPLSIYQKRQEEAYHDTFDVTISSPAFAFSGLSSDTYTMDQITVAYDGIYDNQAKEMKADIGFGVMGLDLLQGKLYVQDDRAYVTVPTLLPDCYFVELSTFGTDFNHSELAETMQISIPEGLSISAFTKGTMTDWEALQEMKQYLLEHAKTLKSYVAVKNGTKTQKGRPVTITLDAYAVNDMMHYLERVCLHSDLYQNQAGHLFVNEEHRALFEGIFETDYTEDLVLNCYMDTSRHLTGVETASPVSLGDAMKLSFSMEPLGEENSLSDMLFSITLMRQGVETGIYEIERRITKTDGTSTETILITENGSNLVDCNQIWDADSKNYCMKASYVEEEQLIDISLKGSFLSLTSGEGFDFQIADLYIKENGEELLRAAGEVSMKVNGDKTVAVDEMDVEGAKDIFAMNRAELFGLVYEGIKSLGKTLLSGSSFFSLFQ